MTFYMLNLESFFLPKVTSHEKEITMAKLAIISLLNVFILSTHYSDLKTSLK